MIPRPLNFSILWLLLAVVFCQGAWGRPVVRPGIDVLLDELPGLLRNKRVGLITNQTGVSGSLRHSIDLLNAHPGVNLTALFAPEHGLTGSRAAGAHVPSSVEAMTGLKVFSLYGASRKPSPDMLEGVDVLLFDIQDIGTRWYTYISTMALAIEAAAENNKQFIVLDRPNPLGGVTVDGPVLGEDYKSFVGMFKVPVLHGMTIGELALFYKAEYGLDVDVRVIRMEGWKRSMFWPDTGLQWVPTSPHIPSFESAMTYPGLGLLGEVGIVSVGVGYTLPFQVAGAPWMDGEAFASRLNSLNLPGVYFRAVYYEPFFGMFSSRTCRGVQVHAVEPHKFLPLTTVMRMLEVLRDMYPEHFKREFNARRQNSFNKHLGTDEFSSALLSGAPVAFVLEKWSRELETFKEKRKPFLLY